MSIDHARPSSHQDAGDTLQRGNNGTGAGHLDAGLTNPNFNREFALASQRPATAILSDFTINHSEKTKVSDADHQRADAPSAPGVRFKNIDASPHFVKETKDAFHNSYDKLNPETQAQLKGLKVVTASQANKELPDIAKDTPAVTPGLENKRGNMMAFSEVGIKKEKVPVQDVMNHEIWHTIDNKTNASHDPELRKAIDAGIARLSPKEQSYIAAHSKQDREQRYAELAGDIMAFEMGSKKSGLAYTRDMTNPEGKFKEAREFMRKHFMKGSGSDSQ